MKRSLPVMVFQKGVVLFIALIALLVMSLAAVALIRSVDTNTVIAGNIALKQSALISADRGVEAALNWLEGKFNANVNSLNNDDAAAGYFATLDVDGNGVIEQAVEDDPRDDVKLLVDTNGIVEVADDGQGNSVQYVVQRMCLVSGPPTEDQCHLGDRESFMNDKGQLEYPTACASCPEPNQSPMYKITVRVSGPKNTVSYTQTLVY